MAARKAKRTLGPSEFDFHANSIPLKSATVNNRNTKDHLKNAEYVDEAQITTREELAWQVPRRFTDINPFTTSNLEGLIETAQVTFVSQPSNF